ncbi:MAG: hypothetical protein AB1801_01700 [Chloroflexota bacterium]
MHKPKPIVLVFPAFFILMAMIGINLSLPPDTHAHPPYGFTPQPPPPPPPPDGGGDDDGNPSDDTGGGNHDNQPPSDYVIIQLERCNSSCSAGYPVTAPANDPTLLAANQTAGPLLQNTASTGGDGISAETLARVRLVHRGSGWIAEGVISDAGGTRFALPYPGLWDVFLMTDPQLPGDGAAPLTRLNLEQLPMQVANGPVSLGTVEANIAETQWVNCPIACIIDPPPPVLPETGTNREDAATLFIAGGFLFGFLGLLVYKFHRPYN